MDAGLAGVFCADDDVEVDPGDAAAAGADGGSEAEPKPNRLCNVRLLLLFTSGEAIEGGLDWLIDARGDVVPRTSNTLNSPVNGFSPSC